MVAALVFVALNIPQFLHIDDDAMELVMKEGVPRFPCLPWPRETPVRRFRHQELRLMKSGAAYDEWHFHPQTEWYLSESMRHAMLRELTAKYLDKRAEKKTVNSSLWIARSRLTTLAPGTDPYTKQLVAVVRRFIKNVSNFEHENIEFEE